MLIHGVFAIGCLLLPVLGVFKADMRGADFNPNTSEAYRHAVEVLYVLSWSIKMSKMGGAVPEGYFDYVVPPLEGLWWGEDGYFDGRSIVDKSKFHWTSMIRQPDFVTTAVVDQARQAMAKKRPELDLSLARLERFKEGLCAQVMHIGSYDDEPRTIEALEAFVTASGYLSDISEARRHHEIYLGDPRKTAPEKRKTVIRHPVEAV